MFSAMEENTYTITDLEKETGLSRRTIHFYMKEKLIPSPDGTGGGARYSEEHILRLRLIGEMQKSHLKLSGIREALDAMSITEMKTLAEKIVAGPRKVWDKEALASWITSDEGFVASRQSSTPKTNEPAAAEAKDFSFLKIGARQPSPKGQSSPSYLKDLKRSHSVREESWQRFNVADGLEVNIRSDMLQRHHQKLIQFIEEFRKNLQKEE